MAAKEARILDLGTLHGDLIAFGGAWGNVVAASALVTEAARRGIAPGRVLCTGDIDGSLGPSGQALSVIGDFGCPTVADATGSNLPDILVLSHHGRRIAVVNGGIADRHRLLWPVSPEAEFAREKAAVERVAGPVDIIVAGRSGLTFHRLVAGIEWVNAGAIGIPPHDGRPQTRFALISEDGVRFQRLSYDHEAAAAVAADGMVLRTGVWTDESGLPAEMRNG